MADVLAEGIRTPDLGGTASTMEVAEAICRKLEVSTAKR
jgi:isocitrate/isopropylmalate dehydrogenase